MKIYTSPMAGYTDYSYRKILKKFNPDLIFTEMINAHLLNENDKTTEKELLKCDDKTNEGVQVFGSDKNEIIAAFLKLEDMGFKNINLNMGCPQTKIIKNGAGSALLPQVDFIDDLLNELKNKLNNKTKLSIKIRIGYRDFSSPELYIDLAGKYHLDFICIHGRTREQLYTGNADWDKISKLSHRPRNTDFIGNGDLFDTETVIFLMKKSNLDGIMLSRGIIGNPWLISQIRETLNSGITTTFPDFKTVKNTILEHISHLIENKGEIVAALEINKFLQPYFKNFMTESFRKKLKEIIIEKNIKKKIISISEL